MKKLIMTLAGVLLVAAVMAGTVSAFDYPGGPEEDVYELNDEMEYELVCSGLMTHPVLNYLANSYDGVAYEDLLVYFCEQEFGVGEIKHALKTAAQPEVDLTYQEILAWVYGEGMDEFGWGEIWQELGLIGSGYSGMDDFEGEDSESESLESELVCAGELTHPVLNYLANSYEGVAYEDLLVYFCEQNFGIGEIKHALNTALQQDVELTYQEILAWAYGEGMDEIGWGEIWQELGLIGKSFDNEEGNQGLGLGQQEDKGWQREDHPGKGKAKGHD